MVLCKSWGGPFSNTADAKKVVKTKVNYQKHTNPSDVVVRAKLYRAAPEPHDTAR